LFRKTNFFRGIPFRSVPFRAPELVLPRNSECLGMSAFFRGITETVPSLFRGIFSERNSVPNPSLTSVYRTSPPDLAGLYDNPTPETPLFLSQGLRIQLTTHGFDSRAPCEESSPSYIVEEKRKDPP
jgi:hypothetical protein